MQIHFFVVNLHKSIPHDRKSRISKIEVHRLNNVLLFTMEIKTGRLRKEKLFPGDSSPSDEKIGKHMNGILEFSTRGDFRKWFSENCLSGTGVWLLFGKTGGSGEIRKESGGYFPMQ